MAMFKHLTPEQIKEFKYYAKFGGLVPVYMTDGDFPDVCVQNGYPEFLLDVVSFAWQVMSAVASYVNPEFEPAFIFDIYGEIEK